MTHPYEKGLFGAAYVSVCLWAVYEWMQPVNGHAVAEETVGHLLIIGALYGFFRLMLAHSIHWDRLAWGTVGADMLFGLYFWYDASAAGIHRYLMLSGPEVFYHILALYMAVRSTFLLRQNGGFSSLQGGRMHIPRAAHSLPADPATPLHHTTHPAPLHLAPGTTDATPGRTVEPPATPL